MGGVNWLIPESMAQKLQENLIEYAFNFIKLNSEISVLLGKLYLFLLLLVSNIGVLSANEIHGECHCYDYCRTCLICMGGMHDGNPRRLMFFKNDLDSEEKYYSNEWKATAQKCDLAYIKWQLLEGFFSIAKLQTYSKYFNQHFPEMLVGDYCYMIWDPIPGEYHEYRDNKYFREYLETLKQFRDGMRTSIKSNIKQISKKVEEYKKESKGLIYHPPHSGNPDRETYKIWLVKEEEKLKKEKTILSRTTKEIDALQAKITTAFGQIHSHCSERHSNIHTTYDLGLMQFEMGNYINAVEDIEDLFEKADKSQIETLSQEIRATLGKAYLESSLYHEAVEVLTTVIDKDPKNKEAYFDRALANFELGEWDHSTSDYLASDFGSSKGKVTNNVDFAFGFTLGVADGIADGSIDFIPGILSSLQGLSHCIWALGADPKGVSATFVDGVYDCLSFIQSNPLQDTALEAAMVVAPELREVVTNWNTLEDRIRGEKVGHLIGKYGVEIFLTYGSMTGVQALTRLKRANGILTLEKLSSTSVQANAMRAASDEWVAKRASILSNVVLEWEKQGKHIPGKHNFEPGKGKSIWLHPDPEGLLSKYTGKGRKIRGNPGEAGFQERVDFGEIIGHYVDIEKGIKVPTSRGTIHYSKTGAHIVPAKPD